MSDKNARAARTLVTVLLFVLVFSACSKGPAANEGALAPTVAVPMSTLPPPVALATINPMAPMSWLPTFDSHLIAGMPEQDVYVQSADDATMVMRPDVGAETNPEMLVMDLFAASEAVPHDPFKLSAAPLGPFPKGAGLGFTLEQWLAAMGTGNYTTESGKASLDLTFDHLVPDGTYTVWCTRLTMPPEPRADDFPCGSEDGSENSFTADADGNGALSVAMPPLLPSDEKTVSMLALAYHSDGQAHGASPGDFGLNSHVQLFWMLPPEVVTQ